MRSRVVSPDLVGRKAERAALVDALDRCWPVGQAGIVLLGGDAGMGKTRLVQDLVAEAGRRACIVLVGGCVDLAEGAMPLPHSSAPLRDLPAPWPAAAPRRRDRRRRRPHWRGSCPASSLGDEGAARSPARPGSSSCCSGSLRRLGNEAPTLVAFEDLHWADQSTRDLLVFLARNLTDERVLMAATFRTDELHRRHPLRPVAAEPGTGSPTSTDRSAPPDPRGDRRAARRHRRPAAAHRPRRRDPQPGRGQPVLRRGAVRRRRFG